MADGTGIEWTDASWNPFRGCSRVSEGCRHCYAEGIAARFSGPGQPYEGLAKRVGGEPRWTGEVRFLPEKLEEPLRWKRPRRIFVNSMADLFHESLSFEQVAAVFGVMAACPQHTFQVLTKRPERAREFFEWLDFQAAELEGGVGEPPPHANAGRPAACVLLAERASGKLLPGPAFEAPWPLPNVELLTSVEDQATADQRIPELLRCPAAVHGVSYEPALAAVDFGAWLWPFRSCEGCPDPLPRTEGAPLHPDCCHEPELLPPALDWIIVGGESGHGARRFDHSWARGVRDACEATGVAFFMKQTGTVWAAQRARAEGWKNWSRKGGDPAEWPTDLRVRMFPGEAWP